MSKYQIIYNAKLDEDIVFTIEAPSEEEALQSAETIAWDILTTSSFSNENMRISCQSITEQRPAYTPLTQPRQDLPRLPNSGYTSLASLYSSSRNPALSDDNCCDEDCCDEDCCDEDPTYTRLT